MNTEHRLEGILQANRVATGQDLVRKRLREYRRLPRQSALIAFVRPDHPVDRPRHDAAGRTVSFGGNS